MDLVLFEPEGDAANRLITPVAGKGPALQGNDRVAQPVPLFLGNRSYISADSISKSHGKFPIRLCLQRRLFSSDTIPLTASVSPEFVECGARPTPVAPQRTII